MSRPAVELAPPGAADIAELVARMRDQDVAEVRASDPGADLGDVVRASIAASAWCHAVRVDGELACVFGLALGGTLLTPHGVPWALGTPTIVKHKRTLMRQAPGYIKQMLHEVPVLLNLVHADNSVAVHWLKHMGFKLLPTIQVGPARAPFHPFEMHRHV